MSFIGPELIFFVTRLFSFYRYFDFFETELIILGSILNFFEKSFDSKMGEGGGAGGGEVQLLGTRKNGTSNRILVKIYSLDVSLSRHIF